MGLERHHERQADDGAVDDAGDAARPEVRLERASHLGHLEAHEPLARGPERRLGARAQAELGEDAGDVGADGPLADAELHGDLLVRLARADEAQHVELARGERAASCRAPSRRISRA